MAQCALCGVRQNVQQLKSNVAVRRMTMDAKKEIYALRDLLATRVNSAKDIAQLNVILRRSTFARSLQLMDAHKHQPAHKKKRIMQENIVRSNIVQ